MDIPLRNIYLVLKTTHRRTMRMTADISRVLFWCFVVVFMSALITADNPPCENCEIYHVMQNEEPALSLRSHHQSDGCPLICHCSNDMNAVKCQPGVSKIKDGCSCCYMCARQQGDLCSQKDKCDEKKGLYCDMSIPNERMGYCVVNNGAPCTVGNDTYRNGQQFHLNCSMKCMCQDGHYACYNTCPQEERPPSSVHCKDPQLVKIPGQCCREWVCPHHHSMPEPSGDQFIQRKDPAEECNIQTTKWSPCSATCGMGFSERTTNDNPECQPVKERRLCKIRPCDLQDQDRKGQECKSTWKSNPEQKLKYEGCESREVFELKYCSTCKKHKCCGPGRAKTIPVEFHCLDGKNITEDFMWIKTCECFPKRRCPFE